jgi:DNA-binding CsgD family transcriptional regulator
MGVKIPKPIKQEVLRKWLEGMFRDRIAVELDISRGAVSNIINDIKTRIENLIYLERSH